MRTCPKCNKSEGFDRTMWSSFKCWSCGHEFMDSRKPERTQQVLTWQCLTIIAKQMLYQHQMLSIGQGYAMDQIGFMMDGRTARHLMRWEIIERQRGKPHPSGKHIYRMTAFGMAVYNQGRAYDAKLADKMVK